MKKYDYLHLIMSVMVLVASLFTLNLSQAVADGSSVWYEAAQLQSAATGTTSEVAGAAYVVQKPISSIGCSVQSSPTATVNYRVEGGTWYLASWPSSSAVSAIVTQATCSWSSCYFAATGKPVGAIRSVVSTPSNTTATIKVMCIGMQ